MREVPLNHSDMIKLSNTDWHKFIYHLKRTNCIKVSNKHLQRKSTSFELLIIKEGSGIIEANQQKNVLQAQDIFIIQPSTVYIIHTSLDKGMELYLFKFDVLISVENDTVYTRLKQLNKFPLRGKQTLGNSSNKTEIVKSLNQLVDEKETSIFSFYKRILFEQIMYLIIEKVQNQRIAKEKLYSMDEIRSYINHHFHENITIRLLSSMVGLSPKYFSVLFKKEFGVSVTEYITELRIKEVKQLLTQTNKKIRDIAIQVGYSDEFYLSRKFKQKVGMSPTSYRKIRKDGANCT